MREERSEQKKPAQLLAASSDGGSWPTHHVELERVGGWVVEEREFADEMATVFRSLEVFREPMAAVLLFQEAARRETATAEPAREVAASPIRGRGGVEKCP